MGSIFNPVATSKIVNPDGTANSQLILFLNELLQRVGGQTGGIYSKLTVNSNAFLWDLNSEPIAFVTLANGANVLTTVNQVGGNFFPYRITVIQPAAGAAGTITWPANFLFPGGVPPVMSTANNAIDLFSYVSDGTNMYLIIEGLNYSA